MANWQPPFAVVENALQIASTDEDKAGPSMVALARSAMTAGPTPTACPTPAALAAGKKSKWYDDALPVRAMDGKPGAGRISEEGELVRKPDYVRGGASTGAC
jgi:hypothetical protein